MQKYQWPGYKIQLLGELQRQQNSAQFCDTLLQTEGISVPTHSCVLAALSPYLSQRLSASPSPPSGQKRQLQLQAVKAQTLLKLVGLLYSGELEVKGSIEQNDVLSAARQFGITYLLEGQKDGGMKNTFGSSREKEEESRERKESRKMQDAQAQAKMAGRRDTDSPIEKRSCVSTGTQTVTAGEKTVGQSFSLSGQSKPPTPEPASSAAQTLDFFSLQPQNITLEEHFCSTSLLPSGAQSDGEFTLDRSSDSVTNPKPTSALSSTAVAFPISLNDDSDFPTPQEDGTHQQSSEFGDSIQMLAKVGTGLEYEKTSDNIENGEQPSHANRDEMLGEEKGNSAPANVGMKSLAKMKQMQQMMETTQISIKVKLRRRRTKGEVWEVVSVQDTNETSSVLTSRKQHGSNHKRPQTDLTDGEPPPGEPGPIHTLILQPATTNSSEPPPHPNTTSDSQLLFRDCFTSTQNNGLEPVQPPQPPAPVEESDEQIEKLLEDIMMGLNILPNLERDCKKSQLLQPSHDGAPAICQVPGKESERTQSQMHPAALAAACVYYQDFGTQIGHSSTETAQDQPGCSSLSSVQPDAVLSQQQQQHSPQYHSPVTPMGKRDGMGHQGMPLSKSQSCRHPEAPSTRSDIPTACYPSGQKLHCPACQEPSSQDHQNILKFLPLMNGNEAQSSLSFSSSCMDDLRLPRCLSPLAPSTLAAKNQPILSNSTSQSDRIQPQPSLHGRPWLTEIPASLQFPLSAISHRENICASLPQDTNHSCCSKQRQEHLDLNPQNGGTWAESVEERGTISAGHQNAAELKSDPRKVKGSSNCKQGDAAAPKRRKRKRTSHSQDAAGSLLACQGVKVGEGIKSQISLSVCSVRLSSNNVLAKERDMATSSSNMPNKFIAKPSEPSTILESPREKIRGPGDLRSDQTRIRTRGFLKKTQETPSNTSLEDSSVLKPVACRAKTVYKQEVSTPRRKPGRPPKKENPDPRKITPAVIEKKSHNVESEQQIDNNLPKKEEECGQTKRRCKRRRRNKSESEVMPLKKTRWVESTDEAEADDNDEMIPAGRQLGRAKRPRMVTLKEFQMLIKRQHSKTRKSKEGQDKETRETAKDVDEELTKEAEMDIDITPSQNGDEIEESRVIFNVTVDKNHNQIINQSSAEYNKSQPDDTSSSASKETSLLEENHPVFSFDVLEEEVSELAAEREQPLKNPDEARKACDAGVSGTVRCIADGSRLYCDTHLPQDNKMPSDHNLNPQTPERSDPPLSDAVGFSKSSGCNQEEEEEEVEVDVLLYSPDKVPQTRECENGLDNMNITPEEEEEEDVNEIDVTGDEAE